MKILAVDTALGACSAAVLDGEGILAHQLVVMQRGHAEALAPMVQTLMQHAGLSFRDLDRLSVTTGPGTFTGQRIGLAFMRGLRLALRIPLAGITTLETMAAEALHQSGAEIAAVFHDAKRDEIYAGVYTRDLTLLPPSVLPLQDALEFLKHHEHGKRVVLAGTAAPIAYQRLSMAAGASTVAEIVHPDALWAAVLSQRKPAPDDVPQPLYLRPPDARLPVAVTR